MSRMIDNTIKAEWTNADALNLQQTCNLASNDCISRQAAIDEIEERKNANGYRNVAVISELNRLEGYIMRLPSAQPDGIPLEWIDKHLEWLDNCDNDFAQLAEVGIRAMVEIWKKDKT